MKMIHYVPEGKNYTACSEWGSGRETSLDPQQVTCFTCKVEAEKQANLAADPDACPECGSSNTDLCPKRGHGPQCQACGFCEICDGGF